jgi:RHS repeat-associated protein
MGCIKEADSSDYFATLQVNPSSSQSSQDYTGDPVNVVTGAFTLVEEDIFIPSQRLYLNLTRFYNNQLHDCEEPQPGPFGRGWTHSFQLRLSPGPENGQQTYFDDQGNTICFSFSQELAAYVPPPGSLGLRLEKLTGGNFSLRQIDGMKIEFDEEGKVILLAVPGLLADSDVRFEYDGSGRLVLAAGASGRFISFEYGQQGNDPLIRFVRDHAGRCWRYFYDDKQQLIKVVDPADRRRCYEYAERKVLVSKGKGVTEERLINAMSRVFAPCYAHETGEPSIEVANQYTSDRRVYRQTDATGGVTRFDYNRFTKTTFVTDPDGWTSVYCYDTAGNTTKVRRPGGGASEYIFDERRNLLAEIDSFGNCTEYVDFNSVDWLKNQEEFGRRALGNRADYIALSAKDIKTDYDRFGNRPLVRDALGNTTRFHDYNSFGKPGRIELPDGSQLIYEYDARSGLLIRVMQDLHVSTTCKFRLIEERTYDKWGNLILLREWGESSDGVRNAKSITAIDYDPEGNHPILKRSWNETVGDEQEGVRLASEEQYEWDDLGRMIKQTVLNRNDSESHPQSLTRYFGYDVLGWLIWSISPGGTAVYREYDAEGRMTEEFYFGRVTPEQMNDISSKQRLGTRRWEYDALGRVVRVIESDGLEIRQEWNKRGLCTRISDAVGYAVEYEYDRDGNQVMQRNGTGYELRACFDLKGRLISEKDNLGMQRNYRYDALNRLCEKTEGGEEPGISRTIYKYDAPGRHVTVEYPDGTFESIERNERGLPIRREQGSHGQGLRLTEILTYDIFDRLVQLEAGVADHLVKKFSAQFLDGKRETLIFDALGNTTSTAYDSIGRLVRMTDAEGRILFFEYDADGMLARRWSEDGSVQSIYKYDFSGQLLESHEGSVSHFWKYDRGKVVRHEQRIGQNMGAINYEYDAAGRLTVKSYNDDWWMRFEYQPDSHFVSKIKIPNASVNLISDKSGRVLEEQWENSGKTLYKYRYDGVLAGIENYDCEAKLIFSQSYEHDKNGRPFREVRRQQARQVSYGYQYDAFNRLERVVVLDGAQSPEYRRYAYDYWGNRLEEYREGKLYTSYRYDPADRLTEKYDAGGSREKFEYDKCGNLTGSFSHLFQYDSAQRLRGITNAGSPAFVAAYDYAATDLRVSIKKADAAENIFYDNLQEIVSESMGGRKLAFWGLNLDALLAVSGDGSATRRAYTNSQGSVLGFEGAQSLTDYDPYGITVSNQSSSGRFGFCGKRYDSDTNLYYNRARFYDPKIGRFTQPDAKGLVDGTNLFAYARSNPVIFNDSLGFKSSKSSQGRIAKAYDSMLSSRLDITALRGFKIEHYDAKNHKIGKTYFRESSLFKTERLEHFNLKGQKIGETYYREATLFKEKRLEHINITGEKVGETFHRRETFFKRERLEHYNAERELKSNTYFEKETFFREAHFSHFDLENQQTGASYIRTPTFFNP